MRKSIASTLCGVLLFCQYSVGHAALETVTLSVPNMYCPVCPLTVKKALSRVEGVTAVQASSETKTATVTFDDTKTNIEALIKATADAGYPATLKTAED
jgi:periplasmic mercuric ion binding protein